MHSPRVDHRRQVYKSEVFALFNELGSECTFHPNVAVRWWIGEVIFQEVVSVVGRYIFTPASKDPMNTTKSMKLYNSRHRNPSIESEFP